MTSVETGWPNEPESVPLNDPLLASDIKEGNTL